MRKMTLMLLALLLVLASAGLASAQEQHMNGTLYTLVDGDTPVSLSQRAGVPWANIAEINNLGVNIVLQPGDVIILPGKTSRDPLSERFDLQGTLKGKWGVSNNAHPHTQTSSVQTKVFPVKTDDGLYVGVGGKIQETRGETSTGWPIKTTQTTGTVSVKKIDPNGNEMGATIGVGVKEEHKKPSEALTTLSIYKKFAATADHPEFTVWAGAALSNKLYLEIGGRAYPIEEKYYRLFVDGKISFDDFLKKGVLIGVGGGITDRRDIVEFGAGAEVGTKGFSIYAGPTLNANNLFCGVDLESMEGAITIGPDGKTVLAPIGVDPVHIDEDGAHSLLVENVSGNNFQCAAEVDLGGA